MIPTIHKLEPAYTVIEKLGGKSFVAEAVGLDSSALSRWCTPSPKGTGGVIPQRHWPVLLKLARKYGVPLEVSELAGL